MTRVNPPALGQLSASEIGNLLAATVQREVPAAERGGTSVEVVIVHNLLLTVATGDLDMSTADGRVTLVHTIKDALCLGIDGTCTARLAALATGGGRRRLQSATSSGNATLEAERAYRHGGSPNASIPVDQVANMAMASFGGSVLGVTTSALSATTTVVAQHTLESSDVDDTFASATAIAAMLSAGLPPSINAGPSLSVTDVTLDMPPRPPPPPPPSPPSTPLPRQPVDGSSGGGGLAWVHGVAIAAAAAAAIGCAAGVAVATLRMRASAKVLARGGGTVHEPSTQKKSASEPSSDAVRSEPEPSAQPSPHRSATRQHGGHQPFNAAAVGGTQHQAPPPLPSSSELHLHRTPSGRAPPPLSSSSELHLHRTPSGRVLAKQPTLVKPPSRKAPVLQPVLKGSLAVSKLQRSRASSSDHSLTMFDDGGFLRNVMEEAKQAGIPMQAPPLLVRKLTSAALARIPETHELDSGFDGGGGVRLHPPRLDDPLIYFDESSSRVESPRVESPRIESMPRAAPTRVE